MGMIFIMGCGSCFDPCCGARYTATADTLVAENAPPVAQTVPGEVLIEFRAGTSPDRVATILAATNTTIKKNLGAPLTYLLLISGDRSVDETIRRLRSFSEVLYAEPNRIMRIEPGPAPLTGKPKSGETDKNPQ